MNHYKDQINTAPRAIQVLDALRRQIAETQDQGQLNFQSRSCCICVLTRVMIKDSQGATENREYFYEAPVGNGIITPQVPPNFTIPLELSQFNPYGADSLSDAWFSQHVINLDGMTLGQLYS